MRRGLPGRPCQKLAEGGAKIRAAIGSVSTKPPPFQRKTNLLVIESRAADCISAPAACVHLFIKVPRAERFLRLGVPAVILFQLSDKRGRPDKRCMVTGA